MELLRRRWQQIKEAKAASSCWRAKPGIGKSRLTAALEDEHQERAACVPSLFLRSRITRAARYSRSWASLRMPPALRRDDTPADKRAKLERLLAASDAQRGHRAVGGAVGLADRAGGRSGRPRSAAQAPARPRRADRAARSAGAAAPGADAVRGRALGRSDLDRTADADDRASANACRSSSSSRFGRTISRRGPGSRTSPCSRSTACRSATATMLVDHVTGGKALPPGLLDQIVERTDGVPLFVEELTKSVLESEAIARNRRSVRARPTDTAAGHSDHAASLADGARRPARLGARGLADRRRDRARIFLRDFGGGRRPARRGAAGCADPARPKRNWSSCAARRPTRSIPSSTR